MLRRVHILRCHRRFLTADAAPESSEPSASGSDMNQEEVPQDHRDISGLSPYHRARNNGQPSPYRLTPPDHLKCQVARAEFGRCGVRSGLSNPAAVLWPAVEELADLREKERETHPDFFDSLEELRQDERDLATERKAMEMEVARRRKQYAKLVKEFKADEAQREKERQENLAIQNARVEEIQKMFGYAANTADPRFQAMLSKKEMEEKREKKLKIKQAKRDDLINKLKEAAEALKTSETSST